MVWPNPAHIYDKMMAEQKKRASAKYIPVDARNVLGLASIDESVHLIARDNSGIINMGDVPLFMLWSTLGGGLTLMDAVEKLYQKTYDEKYGDPIQNWKRNMHRQQQKITEMELARKPLRRYGLSVMTSHTPLDVINMQADDTDEHDSKHVSDALTIVRKQKNTSVSEKEKSISAVVNKRRREKGVRRARARNTTS